MLSLCVCEIIVVVCVREAAGGEGARDTESKTRTPHKVVGKYDESSWKSPVAFNASSLISFCSSGINTLMSW